MKRKYKIISDFNIEGANIQTEIRTYTNGVSLTILNRFRPAKNKIRHDNINALELALSPEIHHIKHRAKGGGDEKENLVTLPHYKHWGKNHNGKNKGVLILELMPHYLLGYGMCCVHPLEKLIYFLVQRDVEIAIDKKDMYYHEAGRLVYYFMRDN